MSKTYNIGRGGAVFGAVLAATVLASPDVFIEKVQTTGRIFKEGICVVQDLTGGMVNVAQNCTDQAAPAKPTGPSPDVTGG